MVQLLVAPRWHIWPNQSIYTTEYIILYNFITFLWRWNLYIHEVQCTQKVQYVGEKYNDGSEYSEDSEEIEIESDGLRSQKNEQKVNSRSARIVPARM